MIFSDFRAAAPASRPCAASLPTRSSPAPRTAAPAKKNSPKLLTEGYAHYARAPREEKVTVTVTVYLRCVGSEYALYIGGLFKY